MFKIPIYIDILGVSYLIDGQDDPESRGCALLDAAVITIDGNADGQIQIKTLLHEIIEVLNCELDIKLKHYQINLIESGLFQVLACNAIIDTEENGDDGEHGILTCL